jgi:uncharacterized protein (DUF2252 family)
VRRFNQTVAKGRRKGHARAFAKFAVVDDGEARIQPNPPLIVPIRELADGQAALHLERAARTLIESCLASLPHDRRRLLSRYRYADLARKVVGIGSVGTRSWIILLLGQDSSDVLFLQVKEAPRSALERFAGRSQYRNQGRRVVEGQRLMQAAGDIFLGWLREPAGGEVTRRPATEVMDDLDAAEDVARAATGRARRTMRETKKAELTADLDERVGTLKEKLHV